MSRAPRGFARWEDSGSIPKARKRRRRTHFETPEPRLLLSATPFAPNVASATDVSLVDYYDGHDHHLQLVDVDTTAVIASPLLNDTRDVIIDMTTNAASADDHVEIDFAASFFTAPDLASIEAVTDGPANSVVVHSGDAESIDVADAVVTVSEGGKASKDPPF